MNLRPVMEVARAAWSDEHARRVARDFLNLCGWQLEVDESLIEVPCDAELFISSWAVNISDRGFGDHVTVAGYLGVERSSPNVWPVHGVLKLYLNADGEMISEDRYTVPGWFNRG